MSLASSGISRRRALQLGAGSAISLSLSPWLNPRASAASIAGSSAPKNVIYMIADGMSIGVPSLAEPFSRLVRQMPTHWYQLAQDKNVTHGLLRRPRSIDGDRFGAGSFGARKRFAGLQPRHQLFAGWTALTPLGPLAKEAGRKVGIVTTATVTHATPAGFLAAEKLR